MQLIEPPRSLERKIILGFKAELRRRARLRLWRFGAAGTGAFGATAWYGAMVVKAMRESGFYDYLVLAFGSGGTVFTVWRELIMALLDTLPAFGLAVFLSALGAFLWSAANATQALRRLAWQQI